MDDDMKDFMANLNAQDESHKPNIDQQAQPPTAGAEQPQIPGLPPGTQLTPEQIEAIKRAQEMKKKMDERPLELDKLKGEVDIKWFGHAGFKISFLDDKEI